MRVAWTLALLAGCSPSPLARWSDDELCPTGAPTVSPIPAPRVLRQAGDAFVVERRWSRGDEALDTPALARVAPEGGGVVIHALDGDALDEVAARCGLDVPAVDEAYALAVRPGEVLLAARSAAGRARAAALLDELWGEALPPVLAVDWPAVPLRGVLEGFYGPAWSMEERAAMLRFTWSARMNTLVWAPKAELLSRVFWREPYSTELRAHLRDLAREARALEVELCAELSPGAGIAYADPAERAIIVEKLGTLVELGVGCLAIAFDDIPRALRPEDAAAYPEGLGAAQAALIAPLFAELAAAFPGVRLGFVPTDYSTRAMREHAADVGRVAAALPASVFLGWTGEEIVSPTVRAADVEAARALWGRRPLMGDNYPVTDGDRASGRVQLGPVVGREAAAFAAVDGWIANAMTLPRASTLALLTIADQAWWPERYDAERAWARALDRAGGAQRAALARVAAYARSSALERSTPPSLAPEVLGTPFAPAALGALDAELSALAALPEALAPLGPLADELAPWSAQLAAYGRAGQALAAWVALARRGGAIDAEAVDALAAEAARLRRAPAQIGDGALDRALEVLLAELGR